MKNNDCFRPNFKLISVENAKKKLARAIKNFTKKKEVEEVGIEKSENRILAEDLLSNFNIPPFDNSAVDGFGINFKDFLKKKIKVFKIVGSAKPGQPFKEKISSGEAIQIYTGAMVPSSKSLIIDTVLMNEDCNYKNGFVEIPKSIIKGSNIRSFGEDIKKKSIILKKGRKIRSVDLGLIASVGKIKVKVFKKVKVGIFSTGDELSRNKTKKNSIQIFDSNKITLLALFKRIGCEVFDLGIVKDHYNESKKRLLNATPKYDLIVTTGGISSGKTDKIIEVVSEIGSLKFWRIAVKPGRPIAFGNINNVPFFGLPGNPVAVIVTFFMFVLDFTYRLNGRNKFPVSYNKIPSGFNFKKKKGRTEWIRGSIKKTKDTLELIKFNKQGSGILSSISNSEGIIELDDKFQLIKKGDILKFYRYEDLLN